MLPRIALRCALQGTYLALEANADVYVECVKCVGRVGHVGGMSVRALQQDCGEQRVRSRHSGVALVCGALDHARTVVHKFGLPNRHGIITCDNYLLHLRFDQKNDSLVYVWAAPVEPRALEVNLIM